MKKINGFLLLFCLMMGTSLSLEAQGVQFSDLCGWTELQYDGNGKLLLPKYKTLTQQDKIISSSGREHPVPCAGLVIVSEDAYHSLFFEKVKQDSLVRLTKEYIELRKEVTRLTKQIDEQKDQIIRLQDVAIEGYRQVADSSFSLTERSMANTDKAVSTISRAQRQTWLFTLGGVAVGATVGLLAGILVK